jgi:SAM-dependent methyltransferase
LRPAHSVPLTQTLQPRWSQVRSPSGEPLLACRLCGSTEVSHVFTVRATGSGIERQAYELAICSACDLLYVASERPARDARTVFEDEHYMETALTCAPWRDWNVREHFVPKLGLLERHGPVGRLLDIGCGDGLFLEAAHKRGWQCFGVEYNPSLAASAARRVEAGIVRSSAQSLSFETGAFDAATLIHVLEHMDEPRNALADARRVLRTGGLLYVAIPCLDPAIRSLAFTLPSSSLRRKALRVLAELWPPDHLLHFPARTLRWAVEREGFRVMTDLYVNNRYPFSLPDPTVRLMWLLAKAASPFLGMMRTGLHYELLARAV